MENKGRETSGGSGGGIHGAGKQHELPRGDTGCPFRNYGKEVETAVNPKPQKRQHFGSTGAGPAEAEQSRVRKEEYDLEENANGVNGTLLEREGEGIDDDRVGVVHAGEQLSRAQVSKVPVWVREVP